MASWNRIARRIRVPLGFLFAIAYLWLALPTWASIAVGAVVVLAGVAVRAAASGHVRKDAVLTTTGPYARTRNPLYLGSVIIALGFAIAARSWAVLIVIVLLFLAIYVPTIRSEEAYLRATFPEFGDYAARVPRFLPRLRSGSDVRAPFSRALYLQHREYNALLGAAAMLAALIVKLLWWSR